MTRFLPLALLLLSTACERAPTPAEPAENSAAPAAAKPVALAETSDLLEWKTGWPAEAAAIPALDALLRKGAGESKEAALKAAREDQAAAKQNGFTFQPHLFQRSWTVEGSPPALLSLSGAFEEFTGGAHGMTGWQALLWDRKADREIAFTALFADPAAAEREIAAAFCPALDAERTKRRGTPVTPDANDPFTQCPKLSDQTLIPAGPAGEPFTRIRVLVGPYEAGPYAEGSYEIAVPVTAALVALVKPEWNAAFGG